MTCGDREARKRKLNKKKISARPKPSPAAIVDLMLIPSEIGHSNQPRWPSLRVGARPRRSYGKIGDWEQSKSFSSVLWTKCYLWQTMRPLYKRTKLAIFVDFYRSYNLYLVGSKRNHRGRIFSPNRDGDQSK